MVLLREDETFLTGEGASRRGMTEPHRVAREFKRRLGDTTPILLGGVPYSAEALMARLLRSVVDEVSRREGGPPAAICVSHPANWGGLALALTGSKSGASGSPPPGGGSSASAGPTLPADEVCSDAIKSNPRWVCLTKATITDTNVVIEYVFGDNGTAFNISRGFHLHIYGASADGRTPADRIMGTQSSQHGSWYVEDAQPSVHEAGTSQYDVVKDSPKVCARIAQSAHRLVPDNSGKGTFVTGNCVPLTHA